MTLTEEQEEQADKLWIELRAASGKVGTIGYKAGQGAENRYASAALQLARLGLLWPVKRKYRS